MKWLNLRVSYIYVIIFLLQLPVSLFASDDPVSPEHPDSLYHWVGPILLASPHEDATPLGYAVPGFDFTGEYVHVLGYNTATNNTYGQITYHSTINKYGELINSSSPYIYSAGYRVLGAKHIYDQDNSLLLFTNNFIQSRLLKINFKSDHVIENSHQINLPGEIRRTRADGIYKMDDFYFILEEESNDSLGTIVKWNKLSTDFLEISDSGIFDFTTGYAKIAAKVKNDIVYVMFTRSIYVEPHSVMHALFLTKLNSDFDIIYDPVTIADTTEVFYEFPSDRSDLSVDNNGNAYLLFQRNVGMHTEVLLRVYRSDGQILERLYNYSTGSAFQNHMDVCCDYSGRIHTFFWLEEDDQNWIEHEIYENGEVIPSFEPDSIAINTRAGGLKCESSPTDNSIVISFTSEGSSYAMLYTDQSAIPPTSTLNNQESKDKANTCNNELSLKISNPVVSSSIVRIRSQSEYQLKVYNILGQLVSDHSFHGNKSLTISQILPTYNSIASGLYILSLQTSEKSLNKKMLLQH